MYLLFPLLQAHIRTFAFSFEVIPLGFEQRSKNVTCRGQIHGETRSTFKKVVASNVMTRANST